MNKLKGVDWNGMILQTDDKMWREGEERMDGKMGIYIQIWNVERKEEE